MSTVLLSMGYKIRSHFDSPPPRIEDLILTHFGEGWVGLTSFMKRYPAQHKKRATTRVDSLHSGCQLFFLEVISTILFMANTIRHDCLCQTSNTALMMDLPSGSTNRPYIFVDDIPRAPLLYLSINELFSSC